MKRGMILFSIAAMLAVSAWCQTAMLALDDVPGTTPVCVTNYGPQVASLTARVTGLEGSSNDWSKTVSNLAALSNNVSALSSRVTATNALFSAWFAGLQSRTSYWDTAYSWGDWHSAVAQKLDITSTNGWETGSHAAFLTGESDPVALTALAVYAATNGSVKTLVDSAQPSRYLFGVVNGTGTVFEVTGPFTNLMVTLSEDFEEFVAHTRPAWTNNVFPFTDGAWTGVITVEGGMWINSSEFPIASWSTAAHSIPATLIPGESSQGTATVSVASTYYTTNAIKHFSTEAELEAAKSACGVVLTNTVNEAVSNLTADITSATNALMPYTRTLYGDLATTNETGFAAFNATNAAESYSALIPSSAVGSFTNIFRYNFNGVRKFGTLTNTARFLKSGFGAGYKAVSTLVSVKDASGNVLSQSSSQPVYLSASSSPSALTNVFTMPDNVYSGTVDVACIAVSTNASFSVWLYSGAQYTNLLTFSEAPMAYATHTELRALRAEIPAIVMSNSVSALTIWTNEVGAVTNMAWRENGTWQTNALGGGGTALPPGIVTNGMGGMLLATNAAGARYVRMTGDGGGWGSALEIDGNLFLSNFGASIIRFPGGGSVSEGVFYSNGGEMGFKAWRNGAERWVIRSLDGHAYIDNGNITVAGTNTAAEVRTLGGYSIFDSGSNCYWRVTASNGTFYASDTNGVRTIDISPAVNSIVRDVSVSSTNILVSSTNAVYYVALDNAANIGFDFSALSLGGTKRADITAVIDCLNTQALYSAINTNLFAMDFPWEPTVTGRYELAVSSDGVRTAARQVWPQVAVWRTLKYAYAPGGGWVDSLQRFHVDNSYTNSLIVEPGIISPLIFVRFNAFLNVNKPISFEYGYASVLHPGTDKPSVVYGPFGPDGGEFMDVARPVEFGAETTAGRLLQVWIGNQSPEPIATVTFYPNRSRARAANDLERAAYNAGAYPAAFRLDY